MKTQFIILFTFCFVVSMGQSTEGEILKYQVKGSSSQYDIFPKDSYLFQNCKNKIKITSLGKNKIADVKITNGTITKSDSDSTYIISGLTKGMALLSIYEKGKDGKNKVALNKEYSVVPYPKLNYNGTKCDSAITRLMLIGGRFYAIYNKKIIIPVKGFTMEILENNKFIEDTSLSNVVTNKMRIYVKDLKPGSIIYLKNIKHTAPNGHDVVDPIFRVFIGPDEKAPYLLQID